MTAAATTSNTADTVRRGVLWLVRICDGVSMSTLSSSSSDAEVWASYDDNASFEEDGSATKAAAFVTACRILLRRRPQTTSVDGTTVSFDAGAISDEMMRAQKWLASNRSSGAGGVRFLDFSGVRD